MRIELNGEPFDTAGATTISELLEHLNLLPQQVAVEVNLELVPRREHGGRILHDGDRLEIVTLAGGG